MTNKQVPPAGSPPDDDSMQDSIATLLRSAGPRAMPDPRRMERARQTVLAEWHSTVGGRRNNQWYRIAAALIVAAVGVWLIVQLRTPNVVPVATVTRVMGDVVVRRIADGKVVNERVQAGAVLSSGEELDTNAAGRVLLDWAPGVQLRIDQRSLVHLKSSADLRLPRGGVYVEIGPGSSRKASQLTVSTPSGAVRHVGTRFEVRVVEDGTRIRVRDGVASFSGEGRPPIPIKAGQQLSVSDGGVKLEAGPGSADPAWDWAREIAPPFTMEGRSLYDTLAWLSHESGLRVVYRSEQARSQARAVVLRGSIEGLDAQKAFLAVLSGSGLAFELHADRVEIDIGRSG